MPTSPAHAPLSDTFRSGLAELAPSLRARALKLCLDGTEASDLVQDTIERALRFESSYQHGTNLKAWVHQILFSVFVTRCRKRRRERNALCSLVDDPCAWTKRDTAPEMSSLTPRVSQALDALPPQFGAVVRLVDLHDHSYKEAAASLGVPVGTVMSRLYRGRRMLARALEETAIPSAPSVELPVPQAA